MNHVIDYIYAKTGEEHELYLQLHCFITGYDSIESHIKYKIPFYSKNKVICYVNPLKKGGVEIVFWYARRMERTNSHLDFKKRKWFGGIAITKLEDHEFEVLNALLEEAIEIDDSLEKDKPFKLP